MKVLHQGQGAKIEPTELKRRYVSEARKNLREFVRIQKRSKILSTKQGRYLIEFHVPMLQLLYKNQSVVKHL